LNVVRIADSFQKPPKMGGGLAPTIYYLSESQASQGLKVYVVCRRRRGEKCLEKMGNIEVRRVGAPFSVNMLQALFTLNRRMKVDVVHAHATTGFSYAVSRKFWKFMLGKFVSHVHGTTKGIMFAWKELKDDHLKLSKSSSREISILRESLIWRNSDGLVTTSQFLKKELVELYGVEERKIRVIYNGVDLRVFRPLESARKQIIEKHGLREGSKLVLYLGGARLVKGPLTLLQAFKKVNKEMDEVTLLFVGKALKNRIPSSLKKLVGELEKKKVVLFLDKIPYLELPSYYSAVDAVVVPSIYDTFPKVVLEALACKTPVVASNTGGIPEIITDGETGLLFKLGNSVELAEAIISVLTDSKLRRRMRMRGRMLVEERFTWEKVANRCLKAYKEILCG
jgi:glycosyltransferase involved in cell wall biosynthesis